jgi:hypothetical protein
MSKVKKKETKKKEEEVPDQDEEMERLMKESNPDKKCDTPLKVKKEMRK